jgi:enoyl-CoA hydratase/carnithine racemase
MGEFLHVEREGAVATIRLDRPPANAFARPLSLELSEAARSLAGDAGIRAIVVWGGERLFAAGADIRSMVDYGPAQIRPDVGALEQACRDVEAIPVPVVAAIEGFALGGGLEVALACDLRIAGETAKLGLPEIGLGIIPGAGGTQRLPRVIGLGRARELILTGRQVAADEALAIGLVNRVVPAGEAYATALEQARGFADGPTLAHAAAKRALAAAGGDLTSGLAVERDVFVPLFDTHDQEEGMRAFLEKRDPDFQGR